MKLFLLFLDPADARPDEHGNALIRQMLRSRNFHVAIRRLDIEVHIFDVFFYDPDGYSRDLQLHQYSSCSTASL
jgi:hypothetical protein